MRASCATTAASILLQEGGAKATRDIMGGQFRTHPHALSKTL